MDYNNPDLMAEENVYELGVFYLLVIILCVVRCDNAISLSINNSVFNVLFIRTFDFVK